MPVRHACPLCDFSREALHSTVLDPTCPSCGAVLAAAGAPEAADPPGVTMGRMTKARWFERTLLVLVLAPLLAAAAKLGWSAAGPAGAAGALVLAGLVSYVSLAPATTHR
jgi:hypothetical protein